MDLAVPRKLLLVAFALAALLVTATSAHAARCRGADARPGTASVRTLDHATLCLMNAQRRAHGRRRLHASRSLRHAANDFAHSMVHRHFFDHTSPTGSTMVTRIRATAYLRRAGAWSLGENIAWGGGSLATPRAIVRMWMHSAGHRANLLNPRFRHVGVGIALGAPVAGVWGGTYVTDFGSRR